MTSRLILLGASLASVSLLAQSGSQPDWAKVEEETMRHFQALLRLDTSNPPGNEQPGRRLPEAGVRQGRHSGADVRARSEAPERRRAAEGQREEAAAADHRPHRRRTVDPAKWKFPPFSATRDGGYVYGRGTVDDKDNLTAALMTMLMLKRLNVPLDRDVIFLAEAGEEGSTGVGIELHGERALSRDRRGVLPGRRRRRDAHRRRGEVRVGADARKDSARHRVDGARHFRTRIGSAEVERDRASRGRGRRRSATWQPDIRFNETTAHLLPPARRRSRRRETPKRYRDVLVDRIRRCRRRPTTGSSRTSRATRRCFGRRCRRTSSAAAIAST